MGGLPGDVAEATEGLWRISSDVNEAMEGSENELWRRWSNEGSESELWRRWSELNLQPFSRFTCVRVHSPILPSHHVRHLASRPCSDVLYLLNKINLHNSCPTQRRVEWWDALQPIYLRSVNSKDTGRPRLMHHLREDEIKLNELDECGEMVEWNLLQSKAGETLWNTYPDYVTSTTKSTRSDRDANSGHKRWEDSV